MELPQDDFLSEDAFIGFESFRFPTPPPRYPTPPDINHSDRPQQNLYDAISPNLPGFSPAPPPIAEVLPVSPITGGLATGSPQPSVCIQCKGQKYGFSAYFHNPRIFLEPPHHLLHLIEQSYFLRDRLKSLLVTYAMRAVDTDQTQTIENEIHSWQREVACFANHVLCSAVLFELRVRPLDDVKMWSTEMSKQLVDHIRGFKTLEMPRGRLQVLLSEFRRAWESVWLGFIEDEKDAAAQYSQGVYQPEEGFDVSQWVEN